MNHLIDRLKNDKKTAANVFLFLFSLSVLFPIAGAVFNKNDKITALGYTDVVVAFLCFLSFLFLSARHRQTDVAVRARAQQLSEYISAAALVLIALFLIGVRLRWDILLLGLGWRYWLMMALPHVVGAFQNKEPLLPL